MMLVELEQVSSSLPAGPPGRESSLPEVVSRAQAGCGGAFGELYRRFAAAVHGTLLARLRKDDADDATQEVFIAAHRRLASLREPAAFGPWLLAIARNLAVDFGRARRRGEAVALDADVAAPGERAGDGELRERVLHHIRALPGAYRETLILRLVEGLSGPEIAALTGLEPGSVRVNLHRGMELLRPRLRKDGFGGET